MSLCVSVWPEIEGRDRITRNRDAIRIAASPRDEEPSLFHICSITEQHYMRAPSRRVDSGSRGVGSSGPTVRILNLNVRRPHLRPEEASVVEPKVFGASFFILRKTLRNDARR